jgi:hypothetical protein
MVKVDDVKNPTLDQEIDAVTWDFSQLLLIYLYI